MNCPYCNSCSYKYGWRKNKRGTFQKYKCKNPYCGIQFIDDDFLGMQTKKEVVSTALRLRQKGLSREEIVEELWKIYKVKRSPESVRYWEKRFSKLFEELDKKLLEDISPKLHEDHTQLKINGMRAYLYLMKCGMTGLIVSWFLSLTKDIEAVKKFKWKAKHKFTPTYRLKEIISDCEKTFRRGTIEVFGHGVKHYCYKGLKDKKNNNTIEREFRLKEKLPQFRSFEQAERFFSMLFSVKNAKKSENLKRSTEVYEISKILDIFYKIYHASFTMCHVLRWKEGNVNNSHITTEKN